MAPPTRRDKDLRYGWHPEPELLDFREESLARAALERLGVAAWSTALDYLYQEAMRRPVGSESYPEMRQRFFSGPESASQRQGPAPAPVQPRASGEILDEFRARLAPYLYNAAHP